MLRRTAALFFAALAPAVSAQESINSGVFTSQFDVHDAHSAAMGYAGAFLPDASPLSFVQNPARLAEAAVDPMVRVAFHGHPDYREAFGGPLGTSTGHVAATGTVGTVAVGAAISVQSNDNGGVASGVDLEFGDRTVAVGGAIRLGGDRFALDLGVTGRATQLRFGTTTEVGGVGERFEQVRPSADVGVIASVDVLPRAERIATGGLAAALAVSAGYAQRGIGPAFEQELLPVVIIGPDGNTVPEEVSFTTEQTRTGSLGLSARFGLDAGLAGGRVRVIALDLASEAETVLNTRPLPGPDDTRTEDRAALIGAMRLRDALLGTSGDPTVEGQRGARLALAETAWLALGRYRGSYAGDGAYHTWGVGASLGGALRLAGVLLEDANLAALGQRYDLSVGFARGVLQTDFFGDATFNYRLVTVGASTRL